MRVIVEETVSPVVLVSRNVECPLCGSTFRHYTPKNHTFSLIRRDSDFCPYYSGANPTLYLVYVCPACNFAAYHDDFINIEDQSRSAVREALDEATLKMPVDFTRPERSLFAALKSFELARVCYQARRFPPEVEASVLQRAAWICRYGDELGRETRYLTAACDLYQAAFDHGVNRHRKTNDLTVAYLVGELLLRTGELTRAQPYFMLVSKAPDTRPTLISTAKDRLHDAKEALKVQRLLEGISLFEPLSHLLGVIAAHSRKKTVPQGVQLFQKGDSGESMFVVTAGHAEIFLEDPATAEPVAVVGPGDTLGEMSLFLGAPRSATVRAGSGAKGGMGAPLEAIEIPKTAFRNLLRLEAQVMEDIAADIARRQQQDAIWQEHFDASQATAAASPASHGGPAVVATRGVEAGGLQSLILPKILKFFGIGGDPQFAAGDLRDPE